MNGAMRDVHPSAVPFGVDPLEPAPPQAELKATAQRLTAESAPHDIVIRGGTIYDGSGAAPFVGDVCIDGDAIADVAPFCVGKAIVEARGMAVAPGFVNMLSHATDSLAFDGRGESDVRQGVTTEIIGETSMHPFGAKMQALAEQGIGVNLGGLLGTGIAAAMPKWL